MKRPAFFEKQINRYFRISILLAIIPSALILCIPFVNLEGTGIQRVLAYIMATAFWLCIILELLMIWKCSTNRKCIENYRKNQGIALPQSKPDVVSFTKTREGRVADIVMFASLITVIVIVWAQVKLQWLILGSVSVLYLSFNLHCLLNGKNYRYIKLLNNYKKEHERDE